MNIFGVIVTALLLTLMVGTSQSAGNTIINFRLFIFSNINVSKIKKKSF